MILPHGPYEAGDSVLILHTSSTTGVSAVGPMIVEACIPLRDLLHWKIEARDGTDRRTVVVGRDGMATDGSVHRPDEEPAYPPDTRTDVIRAALELSAAEWRSKTQRTTEALGDLDRAMDVFDESLDAHVAAVNFVREGKS